MSLMDDPLEGASEAEIQAMLGGLARVKAIPVSGPMVEAKKLRPKMKLGKPSPIKVFEPEIVSINDDVTISVRLPGYMVAGLADLGDNIDLGVREAVREHLRRKGIMWAYPSFLIRVEANAMRAKDLFIRRSRLG
jgi:hypothetical protein